MLRNFLIATYCLIAWKLWMFLQPRYCPQTICPLKASILESLNYPSTLPSSYREKGKRDVALALALNPPELKEHRQADQDIKWLEIYCNTPNMYQADLTFHKVRKLIGKKEGYVQQAIFCIININTLRCGLAFTTREKEELR